MTGPDVDASVSRETSEKIAILVSELERWNERINLVGETDTAGVLTRHVRDSAQLVHWIKPSVQSIVDLGSGAGFPALVIALLLQSRQNPPQVTLVESDQRKAAFLISMIQKLSLRADVIASRIESTQPLGADLVTARALAPLPTLLGYVRRHLAASGYALLPKGKSWQAEVEKARRHYRFECVPLDSVTSDEGKILRISGLTDA